MSEAVPSSTHTSVPRPLRLTIISGFVAGILWAFAIAAIAAEAYNRFPAAVSRGVLTLASTATIVTAILGALHLVRAGQGDVIGAVGALDAQVEQISAKGTRRDMVHREAARRIAAKSTATGTLDRSEYYQVYTDVLMDLSGIRPDEDGGASPSAN